jgi:hypothetical protein
MNANEFSRAEYHGGGRAHIAGSDALRFQNVSSYLGNWRRRGKNVTIRQETSCEESVSLWRWLWL